MRCWLLNEILRVKPDRFDFLDQWQPSALCHVELELVELRGDPLDELTIQLSAPTNQPITIKQAADWLSTDHSLKCF